MKIYVGTDHAGYVLKDKLMSYLQAHGHELVDEGAFSYDENDDYPDFTIPVARAVSKNPDGVKGIIIGATGEPEAIVANKFPHTRAVVYYGKSEMVVDDGADVIVRSRAHNDTNILILGARYLTEEKMMNAVSVWLSTPFDHEDRHVRRLAKIDAIKL